MEGAAPVHRRGLDRGLDLRARTGVKAVPDAERPQRSLNRDAMFVVCAHSAS